MIKLYKVSKFAEDYYKNSVKDKFEYSSEDIQKKLTRNIHLANELPNITKNIKIYQYGNLIIITKRHKIIWLHNLNGIVHFEVDDFHKRKLNKLLDIK